MTASIHPLGLELGARQLDLCENFVKKMRLQRKRLPGLMMCAAGFACGMVVSLLFSHRTNSPRILKPARTSYPFVANGGLSLDCSARLRRCVCDEEADSLKRLARLAFLQPQITSNSTLSPENVTDLKKFLYPDSPRLFPGVPLGVPKLLKQEYLIKAPLLIGILTQQEYLHTRAQAVYDTWTQDISEGGVVFFVGEDCEIAANLSHLPIIRLQGIPDRVYPPLKKAFAVMQYMYDHFIDQYNWFIRADDDMYVRGDLLMELLKKMSPYERVYLGRAGVGKDNDLGRLHLLPHERYCMGGPGVVFSNAAMRAIGPHLNNCLNAVFLHDKHSSQKWDDDDVEIGRCISRKLNFQCSTSEESRLKFHTDYAGDSLRPLTLWSKPILREIVSMHPVKDPINMHAIHHFYKTLEFERRYEQLLDLMSYTNQLCQNLPQHLVPPGFLSTGCNLKLCQPDGTGSPSSYLVNRSTDVLANPTDVYDEAHWKFFTRDMLFDISGISPRCPLKLSIQAELNHIHKLLRKYFSHKRDMSDYTLEEMVYGYMRFLPTTGREFQLRVKFVHKDSAHDVKFRTVRLLRRLSPVISLSVDVTESRTIHVLLPLLAVDDRFREFLRNFVQQGLSKGITLSLVVVLFNEMEADLVEAIVMQFTRGFPKAVVTIVIAEGKYSFLQAIDMGVSVLKNDDIVFVTDVNMRVKSDFWDRCRENTKLGTRTYFPVPFSAYVSDYTISIVNKTFTYPINEWTGKWTYYSFRTFCIVKQDYVAVGGYEGVKFSVEFFERMIHSNLQVFQSPDPSLYRFWPLRTCGHLTSAAKIKACQMFAENMRKYSQPDLIEFLLGQEKSKRAKFWQNTSD